MKLKLLRNKKNILPLVLFIFVIWVLFFDANSYLYQREHDNEIKKLEKSIEFYQKEIEKNRKTIDDLSIQKNLNNYAREKYHYKKKEEYLYLIEYDTIN
ncbi:cell division protein FtsB [Wenyingzhuangia heitensis]|uniref:Cell division protein FtsB n=1 Tax=Wenyingzhuangia heitensis TaxID=1487859 RepID=A0ABX0U819_9FLAO|nr:septum formation initiator family protein [Wenyingzhuangia heitensis]NIJ44983.1 cell division protein FtsB [Wenyingzhuangia heitensis]